MPPHTQLSYLKYFTVICLMLDYVTFCMYLSQSWSIDLSYLSFFSGKVSLGSSAWPQNHSHPPASPH